MFWWPPLGVSRRGWVPSWLTLSTYLWVLTPWVLTASTHPPEYPPWLLTSWVLTPWYSPPKISPLSVHSPEYSPLRAHRWVPIPWVLTPGTPRKDMGPELCNLHRQTDICENITFPQLRWRTVIIPTLHLCQRPVDVWAFGWWDRKGDYMGNITQSPTPGINL